MSLLSFGSGMVAGANLALWWYWYQLRIMRREREEFFAAQQKRIDDLSEWSHRSFERTRREIGLPPSATS